MVVHVTHHACERYIERVHGCSFADARAEILAHAKAIEAAAKFACQVVKLGTGERLILEGSTVLTVYPRDGRPRQCKQPRREDA